MDPEALVTFLFRAPPQVRTVELLGSWDNFQRPYAMQRDRRRGEGCWSGCFRFANIIFDGDRRNWGKPRSGGLKQGLRYWYYYQLDDDVEAFDERQPFTNTCPLMPGQTVNEVDVPSEILDVPNRRHSTELNLAGVLASLPSTGTLEPNDKFARLAPPPLSKVHQRCHSDLTLHHSRIERPASQGERSVPVSPISRDSRAQDYARVSLFVPQRMSSISLLSYGSVDGVWTRPLTDSMATPAPQPSTHPSRPRTSHGFVSQPLYNLSFPRALNALTIHRNQSLNYGQDNTQSEECPWPSTSGIQMPRSRPATVQSTLPRTPPKQRSLSIDNNTIDRIPTDRPPLSSGLSTTSTVEDLDSPATDVSFRSGSDRRSWSPTFSQFTISTAGADTPFQRSARQSRTAAECLDADNARDEGIRRYEDETMPSQPPQTRPSVSSRCSPIITTTTTTPSTANFPVYALPRAAAESSSTITAKSPSLQQRGHNPSPRSPVSSPRLQQQQLPPPSPPPPQQHLKDTEKPLPPLPSFPSLPAVFVHDTHGSAKGSMLDDIFSEFGFLSSRIV